LVSISEVNFVQGNKEFEEEGDEGFDEAFDDAINFPTESSTTTTVELDWSGGSIVEEPIIEKNWLKIAVKEDEPGNFIIVHVRGILERINPLLYEGSFACGQHKVFLEEENDHLKIQIPAQIDVNQKDILHFHHINAAVGRNEVLDAVTKENNNTDMLEAHISIDSKFVFKTEVKFDIEIFYC